MGVSPFIGRAFVKEDQVKGSEPVAIISYGMWQRRFGANPNVLGSTITLGGTPCTIIGVMPAGFDIPLENSNMDSVHTSPKARRNNRYLKVIGRLKPTGYDRWSAVADRYHQRSTAAAVSGDERTGGRYG